MINFILMFLPSFLHVFVRKMLGAEIGSGSKLRLGTLIRVPNKKINIGKNVVIGPLSYVAGKELEIGSNSAIKSLSVVSTAYIQLDEYTHIAPLAIIRSAFTKNSRIVLGRHSRIFPYCWIDTGEGVYIGDDVGVGGHTLIFTHGSWPDYINGGPVSFGPVKIENNVWIPWRVFILPGVTIGENSVIGANSTVNKSIPARSLAAGSPAKILKENLETDITSEEKLKRAVTVINDYADFLSYKNNKNYSRADYSVNLGVGSILVDDEQNAKSGDLVFFTHNAGQELINKLLKQGVSVINHPEKIYYKAPSSSNALWDDFVFYVRRFGIRLEYK